MSKMQYKGKVLYQKKRRTFFLVLFFSSFFIQNIYYNLLRSYMVILFSYLIFCCYINIKFILI